jgi:tape measure domain-containing protein
VNSGNAQKSVNVLQSKLTQLSQTRQVRINVDTSQVEKATQALNNLSRAQTRASQAHFKGKAQGLAQGKAQGKAQNTAQAGGMGIVGGLKGAFVALGGMAIINEIKQTADAMMSLSSRIKLVTKDETERLRVERALYDMSNRNRASLEDVGDLYYKTALSAKQFGISQEDLLRMTDIVTKSLTIGGADTAQQKATILQLSQALGSGVLQGDELRSLRENAPKLMTQIAQYFGKTVAELKEMGAKGELTTDQLVKAILASGQTIDKEFGRITPTIGQAITVLGNKWSKFILDIQNNTGVFGQIAGFILDAVDLIGHGIDWAKEEFKTLEPDFQDFFGNLKELWAEMQPLLDNLGTIFRNWIIPALKIFLKVSIATFGMVADLLKPIVDFLDKIASLIATISGGLPGIIKGFDNLIGKAESGALQQYRNIMTENNQTNNITVQSQADAGRMMRETNTFFEATAVD